MSCEFNSVMRKVKIELIKEFYEVFKREIVIVNWLFLEF